MVGLKDLIDSNQTSSKFSKLNSLQRHHSSGNYHREKGSNVRQHQESINVRNKNDETQKRNANVIQTIQRNGMSNPAPIKIYSNFNVVPPQRVKELLSSSRDNAKDKVVKNVSVNPKSNQLPTNLAPLTAVQSFATTLRMN